MQNEKADVAIENVVRPFARVVAKEFAQSTSQIDSKGCYMSTHTVVGSHTDSLDDDG